jgi:TctA family transporter
LLIRGLHPGPLLFIEQKEFVWGGTKTFKNS